MSQASKAGHGFAPATHSNARERSRTHGASRAVPNGRGIQLGVCLLVLTSLADAVIGEPLAQWASLIAALWLLRQAIPTAMGSLAFGGPVLLLELALLAGLVAQGGRLTVDSGFAFRLALFLPLLSSLGFLSTVDARWRDSVLRGLTWSAFVAAALTLTGAADGAGHIELTRIVGGGLPLVATWTGGRPGSTAAIRFAGVLVLAGSAGLAGARGPLAVGLLLAAFVLWKKRGTVEGRIAVSLVFLSILGLAILTPLLIPHVSISETQAGRLSRQFEVFDVRPDELASFEDRRDNVYAPSITSIREHPFGQGLPAELDNGAYPHNFVLELGVSYGIAGLLAGICLLVAACVGFVRLLKAQRDLAAVCAFFILNSMYSGDLAVNRWICFSFAALFAGIAASTANSQPDSCYRLGGT